MDFRLSCVYGFEARTLLQGCGCSFIFLATPTAIMSLLAARVVNKTYLERHTVLNFGYAIFSCVNWKNNFCKDSEAYPRNESLKEWTVWTSRYHFFIWSRIYWRIVKHTVFFTIFLFLHLWFIHFTIYTLCILVQVG